MNHSIDYSYSFASPHRITLSIPTGEYKTLVDASPEKLLMKWSYDNLLSFYPLSWETPDCKWGLEICVWIDGEKTEYRRWKRKEGGIPEFIEEAVSGDVTVIISGIASGKGDILTVQVMNNGEGNHLVSVTAELNGGWVIANPAWVDGINSNVLFLMNMERADRIAVACYGADSYPLKISEDTNKELEVPMTGALASNKLNAGKTVTSAFMLEKFDKKTSYIFRPYKAYEEELGLISGYDFACEVEKARGEWGALLERGMKPILPDKELLDAYKACFCDLFVMREPLADGYTGFICGTEVYRSTNPAEPTLAVTMIDKAGFSEEAADSSRVYTDAQEKDGCWASKKGWERSSWGMCAFKAKMIIEHFKLTNDRAFLEKLYPRMKASTCWNYSARQKSKKDIKSPYYGLMPRAMGDCGLMNNGDYFGVYYPTNIHAVAADGYTLEAAKILGKINDIKVIEEIYEDAKTNLLNSIRKYPSEEEGYKYMPGIAGGKTGSTYGSLLLYYPYGILDENDELITGAVRHFTKRMSDGGQPLGTGWMKDGAWVAMTLDALAQTYLKMGKTDEGADLLYSAVNYASPFTTWCEERGAEKNSTDRSGDLQHLWTPLALCEYMRDTLVTERGNCLYIASGTAKEWLKTGCKTGIIDARTYFGKISFLIERSSCNKAEIYISGELPRLGNMLVFIRLPESGYSLSVTDSEGCRTEVQGEKIYVEPEAAEMHINVDIIF